MRDGQRERVAERTGLRGLIVHEPGDSVRDLERRCGPMSSGSGRSEHSRWGRGASETRCVMANGEVVRVGAIHLSTADIAYLLVVLDKLAKSARARASGYRASGNLAGEKLSRLDEWRAHEMVDQLRRWSPVDEDAAVGAGT